MHKLPANWSPQTPLQATITLCDMCRNLLHSTQPQKRHQEMHKLRTKSFHIRRQNTYADIVAKSNTSITELRNTPHATHNETSNQISQLNNKINDLRKIIIKLKENLNRHIQQSNENINALLTHQHQHTKPIDPPYRFYQDTRS